MSLKRATPSQLITKLERIGYFVDLIELASQSAETVHLKNAFAVGLDEMSNLLIEAIGMTKELALRPKRGHLELISARPTGGETGSLEAE